MKLKVIETFQDALTGEHHYPGDEIEISDPKRIKVLEEMNLVEVTEKPVKAKKTTKK